jgi:hypothetical protein
VWYVLNYTQSKEKAGHAIRDATITEESKKQRAKKRKLMRAANGTHSVRKVNKESDDESITSNETDGEDNTEGMTPCLTQLDVKSLDGTPEDCLSSLLMAPFPGKLLPEDLPSSTCMDPLPIDDPFNSYIDQLLGPLGGF